MGLSENEAVTYFSALSLGPSSILKIARNAGIKRTTVYSVMESLKQKALISIETKGFKKFFVAERPEKLEIVLENRKKQFIKGLPDLTALYDSKGSVGVIKTYEGLEAVKSVYESLIKDIKPGEDYLIISDAKRWMEADSKYFMDFTERRAKLPIKIRMLLQDSEEAQNLKKFSKNYNFTAKIIHSKTDLPTNMVVTPEKVVIHQLVAPIMAIVIENKSAIKMHQEMFEMIWQSINDSDTEFSRP